MARKMVTLLLGSMILAGVMTGCGSKNTGDVNISDMSNVSTSEDASDAKDESLDSLTVSTAYGDVEVPYAPQRICVLDLSTMDDIHALGLGDKVVCLQWAKHYPTYLEEYYNSESIISLTSSNNNNSSQSSETEETDPYEIYYGIDADLIIGTTERITKDLYEVLSQIAPTVALPTALESTENLYVGMCENAKVIASIWGMDSELEEMLTPYDELYTQICEAVNGKTFVMTTGNTDLSTIQIGTSSRSGSSSQTTGASGEKTQDAAKSENTSSYSGKSNKKKNTANISEFLGQLGMTEITESVSEDASAEMLAASAEAGTSKEDAANTVISAIHAVNPDAVFVYNYGYSNLEEIHEDGLDLLYLENLECPTCFVSIELTYTSGGLEAVTTTMDQIAEALLD